jgi:hypothetical protein
VQTRILAALFIFPLLAQGAVACGGSATENGAGEASGGTGGASAGASAGGNPAGGLPSSGGGGAVGVGNAGTGGVCGPTTCPLTMSECAGGYHLGTPQGLCCQACIADSTNDCAQGQINYQGFEQTELRANTTCKVDSDCVLAYQHNACTANCGIALSTSAATSVNTALTAYATNNCASCPAPAPPPCPASSATCINGACALNLPVFPTGSGGSTGSAGASSASGADSACTGATPVAPCASDPQQVSYCQSNATCCYGGKKWDCLCTDGCTYHQF